MTTYFDHVSRGASWEVVDMPPAIEVTETELTDEEIAEWTMKLAALSVERSAASLPG
jgi:hypothetical protein